MTLFDADNSVLGFKDTQVPVLFWTDELSFDVKLFGNIFHWMSDWPKIFWSIYLSSKSIWNLVLKYDIDLMSFINLRQLVVEAEQLFSSDYLCKEEAYNWISHSSNN